jgi:hypothetical protein
MARSHYQRSRRSCVPQETGLGAIHLIGSSRNASARVGGEFVTIRGRRNFCVHLRIAEILKAEAIGVRWYQREQRFT